MRVWVDAQIFRSKPFGGIARYWRGMVAALRRVMPDDEIIVGDIVSGADVFLPTYYANMDGIPSVVTVYDLIQKRHPEQFGHAPLDVARMERAISTAAAIVSISSTTKAALRETYGVQSHVIRPGQPAAIRDPQTFWSPYYLTFAGEGYKRTVDVYRAWEKLEDRDGFRIISVGRTIRADLAMQHNHPGVLLKRQHVPDIELLRYYHDAVALIYPSTTEGFGMPLLEAMTTQCPIIVRDAPYAREVCGNDAAIYVSTVDEIAWAMREVRNPQTRAALRRAATKRIRTFSWTVSAKKLAGIIAEVTA